MNVRLGVTKLVRSLVASRGLSHIAKSFWQLRHKSINRFSKRPYVVVLSMGWDGHSYSAARGARSLGKRVLLVTDQPKLHELLYSDALIALDPITDTDAVIKSLEDLPLEAVVISIKHLLLPAQNAIAEYFGLTAVGPEVGVLCNDKFAWRRKLEEAGVHQPRYSSSPKAFAGEPCVRKPKVGTGSTGVVLVGAAQDKREGLDSTDYPSVYFEEAVEGDQYDVEGFSMDGTPEILSIVHERYLLLDGEFPPHSFVFNADLPPERRALLNDSCFDTLRASKVINGAWHVEIRVRNSRAYPIDFANRMGYERFMTLASGADFAECHVNAFLPQPVTISRKPRQSVVQFFAWTEAECEICHRIARDHPEHIFDQILKEHKIGPGLCKSMIVLKAETSMQMRRITAGLDLFDDQRP